MGQRTLKGFATNAKHRQPNKVQVQILKISSGESPPQSMLCSHHVNSVTREFHCAYYIECMAKWHGHTQPRPIPNTTQASMPNAQPIG